MTKKELVLLWHETQMGNMHKCREKHFEFSEIMWKLYEEYLAFALAKVDDEQEDTKTD